MEKNIKNGVPVQGTEPITQEAVKGFLKKDLASCIMLLNSIHSDPDLINHLAEFMYGRFTNAKAAEELKNKKDN